MNHTLIRGGLIVDGTGRSAFRSDVRVTDDQIVQVGADLDPSDDQIDATGMLVLPGFIDAHVHADGCLADAGVMSAMTAQGITSVVLGQDGVSFAPSPAGAFDAQQFARGYFGAINGVRPGGSGRSVAELLESWNGSSSVNAAYLVPHGTLRYAVMGGDQRQATPAEIQRMCDLLEQGLAQGACGMSTGLEYAPACYAGPKELTALLRILAAHGLPHVSHMRGYEDAAASGVGELVDLARQTGVATHISHYHGPAQLLVPLIEDAIASGVDLTFDSYPYLRGASILAMVALPTWLPLANPDECATLLAAPDVAAQVLEHLAAQAMLWPRITLASVCHPDYQWMQGRRLLDVASDMGVAPEQAVLTMLRATKLGVGCVFEQPPTNSDESMRALLRHPAQMASSDGIYMGTHPHPRGWGAFARFLAQHVRGGDWTWEQAAVHMSAAAARRFGMTDRGTIAVGKRADLVVLDPDRVTDHASYDHPRQLATGVEEVLVNGRRVWSDGERTGVLAGRALRYDPPTKEK